MRIKSLKIRNFRGLKSLELEFGSSNSVLLVGANGSGKSSALHCIAGGLSIGLANFVPNLHFSKFFKATDISNEAEEATVEIEVDLKGDAFPIKFSVKKTNDGDLSLGFNNIDWAPVHQIRKNLDDYQKANLPVAIYYPTNRAIQNIDLNPGESQNALGRLSSLDDALPSGSLDFDAFFKWYREREDVENEKRIEDSSYRDFQLQTVRKALLSIFPGEFENLKIIRTPPLRMVIAKSKKELRLDHLSDGEKCYLLMAMDIARRLAMANHGLDNPLEGEGIVLIDEVELHLHPKWQRTVMEKLQETFPKCQFIATTHSPQVIGEVKPQDIYLFKMEQGSVVAERPVRSYGRDSNQILETLMGDSGRKQEIKDRLDKYFELIAEGKMEEAQELRDRLTNEIGADEPEFSRADVLIRAREIIGE